MYAIFQDSGQQYKVNTGDKIYVDLRDLPEGQDTIEFDQVLALGEGEGSRIGQPFVEGAKVVGKVGSQVKGQKITIIKNKPRKTFRRKMGHRQKHLEVTISDIVGA